MEDFVTQYFLKTGAGWAVIGAMMAVMFGGVGSARGIRIAGGQAAGVLSEKPELFGKLLVLMALPGTQGFYGFIIAIFMAAQTGILGGALKVTPLMGLALMAVGICAGIVQYRSAIYQGEASAAAINLTARRPEESGRSILIPALVETYAVVALLASILFIMWVTAMKVA
ncbi:MAG TPA: V-type ATP synthase subunit K [Planctomycetota bacterium]|nr:V-type ATP synthase subunit K [Planctomycetota bacterium]HRR79503.1 V-type ATP synthase subunit K [Planctomycetota bacterium]HRT95261.1 V-type ATP synthase subunit K [Planctomycetota bacterium]